MSHHKLSLQSAILINLNVMVGFGIFINTVLLSKMAGSLGFACYALVATLILPLIISIAALLKRHPSGGFYTYGARDIHPFAGFLSAWVYFTGKLASASLIIHVIMTLLQTLIPLLAAIPTLILDVGVITFFAILNTYHMRVGEKLVAWFIMLKLTPILFAIGAGLYLLSSGTPTFDPKIWAGIPLSIPFVLYAFTGFEAACSLSKSIENPQVNGPKAIYISFILAVLINVTYQFLFFVTTHGALMLQEDYRGAFPTLLSFLIPASPVMAQKLVGLLHLALAVSALGGSYGILLSNHWNLHTLAEHGHTFFASVFTKLNKHSIPTAGVIVEALLCCAYLILTCGNQAPLQQLSALGSTIAYTISVCALIAAQLRGQSTFTSRMTPWLALMSCMIFIGLCINNFVKFGISSLLFFIVILGFGVWMYWATRSQSDQSLSHL